MSNTIETPATVQFGMHRIGTEEEVFVIAEAGVNHDGELSVAHELVDLAADAGANAVKFQTFRPSALVSVSAATTPYQKSAGFTQSQSDMLTALMLPDSAWAELHAHAVERGITFLSSPFDLESAELLADVGVPGLKIGSGELTNTPFLRAVSELGVPLIVSTGMGTPEEVGKALEATGAAPSTVLLHCVSAYPAPAVEANLRAIPAMAAQFRVQVGWSDHTLGAAASIAAVALGATLLEKHITTDKSRKGPDHAASLSPEEAHAYVAAIRATSQSLGDGLKRRMPSEEENARLVRRSLHAARPIAAGSIIVEPDLVILRPEGGLAPSELVVGATAARDISAGSPIIADDLQRDA